MYKQGDIILVPFPFTDDFATSKKRPVVVIFRDSVNRYSYIVVKMTSVIKNDEFSFPLFNRYLDFVLDKPSELRTNELLTIDDKLVIKKIGKLSKEGLEQLSTTVKANFDLS